jgi:hypothetical protein
MDLLSPLAEVAEVAERLISIATKNIVIVLPIAAEQLPVSLIRSRSLIMPDF